MFSRKSLAQGLELGAVDLGNLSITSWQTPVSHSGNEQGRILQRMFAGILAANYYWKSLAFFQHIFLSISYGIGRVPGVRLQLK